MDNNTMIISKQDRVAIILSILISIITFGYGVFFVIVYWCYRFYKNDISFLKIEEDLTNINKPLITKNSANIIIKIFLYFIIFIISFTCLAIVIPIIFDMVNKP